MACHAGRAVCDRTTVLWITLRLRPKPVSQGGDGIMPDLYELNVSLTKNGYGKVADVIEKHGRSTVNRGHEHHRSIRRYSAREGHPRRFGGAQRGSGT